MKSPFKFYIEDGKLVREIVSGDKAKEKTSFRSLAEICNYLSETDNDLWSCRASLTATSQQLEKAKILAKEVLGT